MRKISQYLLIILATISVGILGYHAYSLATTTLVFSLIGADRQVGNSLVVAVDKPWLASSTYGGYLDTDAIQGAITKNGKPWNPTVSGESNWLVTGAAIELSPKNWVKGDTIVLNAKTYNQATSKKWQLPRDISLTYSDDPRGIEIKKIGLPRDLTYELTTYGYRDLDVSDVRWYIREVGTDGSCGLTGWDPGVWTRVKTKTLETHTTTQKKIGTYHLQLSQYPSNSCIIAGLAGDAQSIIFSPLDVFTATGTVTDILSPEYDMQSRIEFHFATDIFADTGTLYSREYIEHRQVSKVEFLKHLSISNNINIGESDLELSPNRAVIYANLIEGQDYRLSLDAIQDIYGRTTSASLDLTATAIPSLSMKIAGNKTIIKYGDPIRAKLYRSQGIKDTYDIKLCQIGLERYARIERMNELRDKKHTQTVYDLLSSNQTSKCIKKTITIKMGSVVTDFDVDGLIQKGLTPGLYVMAFANQGDIATLENWVAPRVFSVVDTHITMKVDSSGKMQFLTTDIRTGEPRGSQEITLRNNIGQLYTQNWNQSKQAYDISYIPLSSLSWGTGILLGKTTRDGILAKDTIELDGNNPYNLTSEWWGEYEGRYSSFVAVSGGDGHFGYVVSTWNDGITGWNFGMKESDYGWDYRGAYSSYIHTDRRLYLPGDTVYIKGYLRKNETNLTIPTGEEFDINITDQEGKQIATKRIRANNYGSVTTSIVLASDASLGSYNISLESVKDPNTYITNGYTNFQVEIFSNPTFTAEVQLSSPQVKNGIIENIREIDNIDTSNPWYDKSYKSNITIEGNIKAHYYNGTQIKSVPFTYKIYKSVHYDMSYWEDCFWGCYYEPTPEFYTEGTGSIDADGYGILRADVEFSSFSDDYIYTVEVTIVDPLTTETVTTPATLLVALGGEYKMYDRYNPIEATLQSRMIQANTPLEATLAPKYGRWSPTLSNKYKYELVHRTYTAEQISTLRGESAPITHTIDTIVSAGSLTGSQLILPTIGYSPGEYILRISPNTRIGVAAPSESVHESLIYITGDFVSRDSTLRVIPERTIYHVGEMARVLITTPFSSGGHLYITRERGGVIDHEYVAYSGSTFIREYRIDESFYPNMYIGAIAYPRGGAADRAYAVGYSEIIMDLSDKQGALDMTTNKKIYKDRETVTVDLSLKDQSNNGVEGEIEVMVIDESLIRLLGNIDLDIIPKFFKKYPFTMKTALTAIGIERNRYLSRKGSNGGSGNKGGDGAQISSRTLFRNTAYYNASIITDTSGKARISFQLPDNITDYRIIAIGQTRVSQFSVSEETISVRRDYTLETHAPSLVYPGDTTTITASVFNSTSQITGATLELSMGTGGSLLQKSETLILQPSQVLGQEYKIEVGKVWNGEIPFTLTLKDKKGIILDSITKILYIGRPPIIADTQRITGSTTTGVTLSIPGMSKNTRGDSQVTISISDTPLQNPERVIKSLITYPYGCIEQTISSTLPNAIAINLGGVVGIRVDIVEARKNLEIGVAKILKMQDASGGWKYWENDTSPNAHVTPYVIRSLYEFRKLGVEIPDDVISRGLDYISNNIISTPPTLSNVSSSTDADSLSEVFATLSRANHPRTKEIQKYIDINTLSRHGYLMYSIGLAGLGELDAKTKQNLKSRMSSRDSESYWYWDDTADRAIYARLLGQIGEQQAGINMISELLRGVDIESYYISTQARIQLLMTLISLTSSTDTLSSMDIATGKLKIPVRVAKGTHRYSYDTRRSLIGNTIDISGLTSSGMVYYDISFRDEPIDIFAVQPFTHPELSVKRVFEKVDESRGLDEDGQFISSTLVTNGLFAKGELYRVRITVTPKPTNTTRYYLTLEDYIPGGWRPINSILKTESSSTIDTKSEYGYWNGWTYVESRIDRVLATQDYIGRTDQPYTYTYYIRPEYAGTYLLPPVTAYYMYQPQIHATGKYEKVIVQ